MNSLKRLSNNVLCLNMLRIMAKDLHLSASVDAARKGTRAKAEAKKKAAKIEVVKKAFIPYQKRLDMEKIGTMSPRKDYSHKGTPIDDVYFTKFYQWKPYTVGEAADMHREMYHPTIFNAPNGFLMAFIELGMSLDKKNQFANNFSNVIKLPYYFDTKQTRSILAITSDESLQEALTESGVDMVVGKEAIKLLQSGQLDPKNFSHIITHNEFLQDLVPLRAILRKKFPTPKTGTAGNDLIFIAERFLKGLEYDAIKDKYDPDYALIETPIGTLNMPNSQLEANLSAILQDISTFKPSRKSTEFITLVQLRCKSTERFKINHHALLSQTSAEEESQQIRIHN